MIVVEEHTILFPALSISYFRISDFDEIEVLLKGVWRNYSRNCCNFIAFACVEMIVLLSYWSETAFLF